MTPLGEHVEISSGAMPRSYRAAERGFSRDGFCNSSLEPLNLPRVFDEVRRAT